MDLKVKARYFSGVLYPENMVTNWQDIIGDKLQHPLEYCVHDKDLEADGKTTRKTHVHVNIALPNTTTANTVLNLLNTLSADGKKCCSTIEQIHGIRNAHDYLIHDTDSSRKAGKHLYAASERISVNNFDIGNHEQISTAEKNRMAKELADVIIKENFTNFADFYMYAVSNFDGEYFDVIKTYSGLFERLTKGNWQKEQKQ